MKDGASVFNEEAHVTQEHEQWLKEEYFPIVAGVHRFPRYKNKRSVDTYVKAYLDEHNIDEQPEWGLPVPNQEAAYKSMSKYAKDVLPMTERQIHAMNKAWEMTDQHFGPYMQGARIKTVREVVDGLDKTTSTGFPFNNEFPKKRDLFENDPEIMDFLEKDWENLKNSEYSFCFTNSLKEEVRPAEKTRQNKIRTFTAGAVDGTVHGNRLFSDMNEKMNAGYLRSASGVGMSPMKGNWEKLYQKLNIFRHGYALDESEYDSSLRAYMMWGCARMRWNQYRDEDRTPENLQRLKVYYRNLINSLVITPEGVIVMKLGGNPSGSCNTINDNTLILYTLMAYAWVMLCDQVDEYTYTDFEINTSKILVGDDNTWTVSDYAHRFYNGRSVIDVWKDIGVVTTTDSLESRPAIDLDFLSAKTLFYKGMAIPIYDRTKLMTSLLYSETKSQSPAYTLLRAAALLQNGWTDIQFRRFCREFIAWMFDHFDDICYNDEDWIQAKTAILSDQRLESLYMGEVLYPQSYREVQERLIKLDKRQMSELMVLKKNRTRRGKGAKATRKNNNNNGLAQKLGQILANQQTPKRGIKQGQPRRARGNRPRNPRNNGNQGVAGRVLQGTFGGQQMLRNPRNMSKPRIEDFDERIGSVNGSVALTTTQFALNPANSTTFPWLNKIAQLYERYEFEKLEFYFQHDVSGFATQGQTGLVYLSALYDAASPAWTTETQIVDSDPRVFGMPNENMCLSLAVQGMHPKKVPKFCRPGILPGGADIKEYDAGNLYVSTVGEANTTEIGKLQIKGRVRLFDRILDPSQLAAPTNNQVSFFRDNGAQGADTGTPANMCYAPTVINNGLNFPTVAAGVFTPPAGNYLVDSNLVGLDNTNETFVMLMDIQKNNVSIFPAGSNPRTQTAGIASTPQHLALSYSTFVTANGTDQFIHQVTLTGAGGVLSFWGSQRWTAI